MLFAVAMIIFLVFTPESMAGWNIESVSPAPVDPAFSFALDKDGQPHISWFFYSDNDFKMKVEYSSRTDSLWSTRTVDEIGFARDNSIAIDGINQPRIAYCDEDIKSLKYAVWTGIAWSTETVDAETNTYRVPLGLESSIAVDKNNHSHITYVDENTGNLRYAKWTGISWSTQIIDSGGKMGYDDLKIDDRDRLQLVYYDHAKKRLKYAEWTGVAWSTETVNSEPVCGGVSIIIAHNRIPHIFYPTCVNDRTLAYANWGGNWRSYTLRHVKRVANSWKTETLDIGNPVAMNNSVALDKNDYPHIAYINSENSTINYVKWTGKSWQTHIVSRTGGGNKVLLALDDKGNPHIVYYDGTEKTIKYATQSKEAHSQNVLVVTP